MYHLVGVRQADAQVLHDSHVGLYQGGVRGLVDDRLRVQGGGAAALEPRVQPGLPRGREQLAALHGARGQRDVGREQPRRAGRPVREEAPEGLPELGRADGPPDGLLDRLLEEVGREPGPDVGRGLFLRTLDGEAVQLHVELGEPRVRRDEGRPLRRPHVLDRVAVQPLVRRGKRFAEGR